MKVIIVRPNTGTEIADIENTLKGWQSIVEGYVESVTLRDRTVVLCNELGKILGMEKCCKIDGIDFVGPIFIAHIDEEAGYDLRGLNDEEIESIIKTRIIL